MNPSDRAVLLLALRAISDALGCFESDSPELVKELKHLDRAIELLNANGARLLQEMIP